MHPNCFVCRIIQTGLNLYVSRKENTAKFILKNEMEIVMIYIRVHLNLLSLFVFMFREQTNKNHQENKKG